jgi:uncharacterized protein (TIGR03086 family)
MTTPELLTTFDATLTHAAKVVSGVDANQRSGPTPCVAWGVETLLDHMVATLRAATAYVNGATPAVDPLEPVPVVGADPAATFAAAAAETLAAFSAPGALDRRVAAPPGTMPGAVFLHFPLLDMWVHSWDLAVATGQPVDFDPDISTYVLGFCQQAFASNRPPVAVIGPEVPVADTAPVIERLVGFLGREPRWAP